MPENKTDLRRHFSALRNQLTGDERQEAEAEMLSRLVSLAAWQKAPLICGYMPTKGEINTLPLWETAVGEGKSYALPVTITGAREGQMVFRRTEGFCPEALITARYGLAEPDPCCPALSAEDFQNALIIVPGLAFDDGGYRIGYGGGYYDRLLAVLSEAGISVTTVGLVFARCHTHALPREPHDIPVDYVIDERRVIIPHGKAQRFP